MQGTGVWALVGATKIPHATGQLSSRVATIEPSRSRACAPQQGEPAYCSEDLAEAENEKKDKTPNL